MTSRIAVDRATYSASVLDKAIIVCNLDCQKVIEVAGPQTEEVDYSTCPREGIVEYPIVITLGDMALFKLV